MKEMAAGTFGKAKPLPGQQGYNLKESDRLEDEARRMEAQLVQVKLGMQQQAQREMEKAKMKDGNRWRSARQDRGSVRQYAQDVKAKATTSKGSSSRSRKQQQQQPQQQQAHKPNKSRPSCASWAIRDVVQWLASVGLSHHAPTFEFNEVSGAVLVDLTPADLDYLQVTSPAERKALLQHIEQLKRSTKAALPKDIVDDKLKDAVVVPPSKAKHWSQLQPLAANKTAVPQSADVPTVNLADGDFNEDASHASFLKALLDWRASDQDDDGGGGHADSELWTNPLADPVEEPRPGGGKLLAGEFDEVQSHAGFLAALHAWRHSVVDNQKPELASASAGGGSPVEAKQSCWQCYKLVKAAAVVQDAATTKQFCSKACQALFHKEYARFYKA
ncbi:hypothetical protein LEN26_009526 [Aphanomyces euteiches]|nr:hypothetical protein AeMF1_009766 [Aphanomyces euteiches]KAH9125746.1 hypothetical protein LEN26_009526 [Aphanomyces euteiches]KAH9187000.1 hypothetical protein AeNC1_011021 [Aphanomyces euteiches]